MKIRPATVADYVPLGLLTREAYETLDGAFDDPDYFAELQDVASRATTALVLVAEDDEGALLGGVTYVGGVDNPFAEFDDPDAAGMRMLAVDTNVRGRGAGEALVLACIEHARADGRKRLHLHTTAWMPAAHRLYERLGFVRDPGRDWAPIPEVPLLAYVFEL